MTFNEIETALGQRLEGTSGLPSIAWPNKDFEPSGQYVEFRHTPNTRLDDTIDGAGAIQTGFAVITVVSPRNAFTNAANAMAQAIADRFTKGLRLTAGSGNVVISGPASLAAGFSDGAYWRQPITVPYVTE